MEGLTGADSLTFPAAAARTRWVALTLVCVAVLMIVLDTTVVNVALPSIRDDLQLSPTGLVWVVNAYLLFFGGSLLLGGRLGDLYGRRRLFLFGVALFTLSSLACGLSQSATMLVIARGIQGVGGAVTVAVALSLIVTLFPDSSERAKAMSLYSFVSATGGTLGLLLGGALTSALSWHWIFLVNIPIGSAVFVWCRAVLPRAESSEPKRVRTDFWGAISVTAALMLFVYAFINGNEVGWVSRRTIGLVAGAGILFVTFFWIETHIRAPLVPLGIFSIRSFSVSNAVRVLWAAGGYAWFFVATLYMQLVLGYGPMEVGLAFLPSNAITALFAVGMLAKLVTRFGVKWPLCAGLMLVAAGYMLFARVPIEARAASDLVPTMVLVGLGTGIAFGPLLLAAMSDVRPQHAGVASGVLNTAAMIGGALGITIVSGLAAARSAPLLATGTPVPEALAAGYHIAFLWAASCAGAAALVVVICLGGWRGRASVAEL